MVDTINPQTGQTDSFVDQKNTPNTDNIQSNNYFAGFNKPEEVRVNLAADTPTGGGQPVASTTPPPTPVPEVAVPVQSSQPAFMPPAAQPRHDTYSASGSSLNMRAILAVAVAGVVIVGIFGLGSYFISKSIYDGKIASENKELADLKSNLESEKKVPAGLELPDKTEPPTSDTTTPPKDTTEPDKNVDKQPIETPQPSNPSTKQEGTG